MKKSGILFLAGRSCTGDSWLWLQHRWGRFYRNSYRSNTHPHTRHQHRRQHLHRKPTATPVQETSQTAAGVTIVKQDATYYATSDGVIFVQTAVQMHKSYRDVAPGTALTSTGVSQDGQWDRSKL